MECLLTLLALLFLFVAVIRATAGGESRGARRRNYQLLAVRLSGAYVPGSPFRAPAVRFRYGDTMGFLTEGTALGPDRGRGTQLQLDWNDPKLRLEMWAKAGGARRTSSRGLTEILSGSPEFDSRFTICGKSEEAVRQFLSDGVQWQILRLAQLLGDYRLHLLISRGRMYIQKPRLIRKFADLQAFVSHGLELYDQAMITQAVGIQFVEGRDAQTLEHVICKVCGDSIASDMVYCRRCKTPHHGECWQYVGACSVYGCQERNYLRPQVANTIAPSPAADHSPTQQPDPNRE